MGAAVARKWTVSHLVHRKPVAEIVCAGESFAAPCYVNKHNVTDGYFDIHNIGSKNFERKENMKLENVTYIYR